MDDNKLVTLAIHTLEKAEILKHALESENIDVTLEEVDGAVATKGCRIKIKESDLTKALNVVENRHLFRYDQEETTRTDDGRPRILIPVDFSDYSLRACRFAFKLAKEINAKVKILHVYFNPYFPSTMPLADVLSYTGREQQESLSALARVKANIKALCKKIDNEVSLGHLPAINYSYVLKEGLPEEEIVSFTKHYKPALIIMGTRGKDQKDVDLIGSVTAEVIEMTRIPLIALPQDTPFDSLDEVKKIVFLTNFSQRDLVSFGEMMYVLQPFLKNFKLTFLQVVAKKSDAKTDKEREKLSEFFQREYPLLNFDFKVLEATDLLTSLDDYIRENDIDILALTTSKRNVFTRMFRPSIPRKMLFHSDTPIIVSKG